MQLQRRTRLASQRRSPANQAPRALRERENKSQAIRLQQVSHRVALMAQEQAVVVVVVRLEQRAALNLQPRSTERNTPRAPLLRRMLSHFTQSFSGTMYSNHTHGLKTSGCNKEVVALRLRVRVIVSLYHMQYVYVYILVNLSNLFL